MITKFLMPFFLSFVSFSLQEFSLRANSLRFGYCCEHIAFSFRAATADASFILIFAFNEFNCAFMLLRSLPLSSSHNISVCAMLSLKTILQSHFIQTCLSIYDCGLCSARCCCFWAFRSLSLLSATFRIHHFLSAVIMGNAEIHCQPNTKWM